MSESVSHDLPGLAEVPDELIKVTVTMTRGQHRAIKRYAREHETSVSELIRMWVAEEADPWPDEGSQRPSSSFHSNVIAASSKPLPVVDNYEEIENAHSPTILDPLINDPSRMGHAACAMVTL